MVLLNRRKYIHRRRPQGAPADLADAVVTLASETVYYTGNPVYPSVSVTYEGVALIVNTDYTLNYSDNTEVGAATVVVTGMGEFAGQVVKTFQIVAASGGSWERINLSNLGDSVANASLRDSTAYYQSNTNLSCLGIQTLPDDSIFFAAPEQGYSYIWGFDEGHAFEVGHFKSTYTSRSRVVSGYKSATLCNDGTLLYDMDNSQNATFKTILDTPYQLATENSRTFIGNAGLTGILPYRMQFSSDGRKFLYRGGNDAKTLYYANLSTPWDLSSKSEHNYFDLGSLSNLPFDSMGEALAFQFSPDGKTLLFTCRDNAAQSGNRKQYLIKLSLSTPYDLSTASVHSYKHLSTGSNWWQGLAVNNDATKMLLHLWNGTERVFYEYNLTA